MYLTFIFTSSQDYFDDIMLKLIFRLTIYMETRYLLK